MSAVEPQDHLSATFSIAPLHHPHDLPDWSILVAISIAPNGVDIIELPGNTPASWEPKMRFFTVAALVLASTGLTTTGSYAEPVDYVRICAEKGAGYAYIPGTETCFKMGEDNGAMEGVAVGMSMQNATIEAGKSFGASINVGTYGGASAVGFSGAAKLVDGLTVNGAVGVGSAGGVGARGGLNFSW